MYGVLKSIHKGPTKYLTKITRKCLGECACRLKFQQLILYKSSMFLIPRNINSDIIQVHGRALIPLLVCMWTSHLICHFE